MSPRRRIGIGLSTAVILLGICVAFTYHFSRVPEPSYHGKQLKALLLLSLNGPLRNPEGKEALHALGTNAAPTLLAMLRANDSKIKLQVIAWAQTLHLLTRAPRVTAWSVNWGAAWAFQDLGPDGRVAVPELIKIYDRHISESSQGATAFALGCVGPEASNAVPHLLRGFATATGPARANTLYALLRIDPESAQTTLMSLLHDPDVYVRLAVSAGLAKCPTKQATLALQSLQNDPDSRVREDVRRALEARGAAVPEASATR